MKKIYLSPAIETLEIRSAFAICDGSGEGGSELNGGGINPAPKRPNKPF